MDGQTIDKHDEANSSLLQLRTHPKTNGNIDPLHATKTYGEAGVEVHIFLVSVLHGSV
jgi:hypothetical protein